MAARDVLFIGAILFVVAMVIFVFHFVSNTMIDQMISNPQINATNSTVTALRDTQDVTDRFDYVIFAFFIGLALALLITGWFIGGNPIYMFIYFIVVIIGTVVGGVLSYVWGLVSQASVFNATLLSFPITDHIITNLHYYIAVLGMIGMIVMFAKPAFQGEGGGGL